MPNLPDYQQSILEKFNNEKVLGQISSNDDKRRSKTISQTANGPYNVSQLSYPLDVSVAPDLQHYIVFYINIRRKTRFKTQNVVDVDVSTRAQNRVSRIGLIEGGIEQATITGGVVAAGAINNSRLGNVLTQAATTYLGSAGVAGSSVVNVLTGLAGGVATSAVLRTTIGLSENLGAEEPARLSDAIMLPIDSIPKVSYKMAYDEYDAGILAGLMGGSSAIDPSVLGRTQETLTRSILAMADIGKMAGLGDAKQNILTASAVQTNPFREVYFKAINFRTFTFSYTFLPSSEKEVYNVKRIIDLFKFHMHPELSKDGLFYVYPSEFEIAYYYSGKENPFLNKISTCVLTDMNVDYGSQNFTSFDNGAPTEIKMTLTFKELELLTKERIVKGY